MGYAIALAALIVYGAGMGLIFHAFYLFLQGYPKRHWLVQGLVGLFIKMIGLTMVILLTHWFLG